MLIGLAAVSVATPAIAETWNLFSRSPNNAFMADADSLTVSGEITSLKVATAPRAGEAGDYSHSVETYEFQCGSGTWRTAGVIEYGPDGAEMERFPEENAAWEAVRPGTIPETVKAIACDGTRALPPTWPSIKAFIDAGRPEP
jgi:hypothetical protein